MRWRKRNSLVGGRLSVAKLSRRSLTQLCVNICTAAQTHGNSVPRANPLTPVTRRSFVLHCTTATVAMQTVAFAVGVQYDCH